MPVGTAVIDIQRGQYTLTDAEPGLRERPLGLNGLLQVNEGYVSVWAGLGEGPMRLTVEIQENPPALELDAWDEVVEVSQFTPSGRVGVYELYGDPAGGGAFPDLLVPRESWFRIRCHARGRDEASALDRLPPDADPIEEHLLQLWPAPQADQVCHRLTDQVGQRWRRFAGEITEPPRSQRSTGGERHER